MYPQSLAQMTLTFNKSTFKKTIKNIKLILKYLCHAILMLNFPNEEDRIYALLVPIQSLCFLMNVLRVHKIVYPVLADQTILLSLSKRIDINNLPLRFRQSIDLKADSNRPR